jgi:hypothetical protein
MHHHWFGSPKNLSKNGHFFSSDPDSGFVPTESCFKNSRLLKVNFASLFQMEKIEKEEI